MWVCVVYFMVIYCILFYFQKRTLTTTLNLHPSNYNSASVGIGNMGIKEGLGRSLFSLTGEGVHLPIPGESMCLGSLLMHSVGLTVLT